jgi:nitrilase
MNRVAVVQMNSGDDVAANLRAARTLLEQAVQQKAQLALLPENFAFMGARDTDKLAHREPEGDGLIQRFLAATASELKLTLVAGTFPLAVPNAPDKVYAAELVFDAQGRRIARYDKIHLFDVNVQVGDKTESYRESSNIEYGAVQPITVNTSAGTLGLTVCYDLRFPELYRALGDCALMLVPAAFTYTTGRAHWELLLRARAVENQCYVLAAAQGGNAGLV